MNNDGGPAFPQPTDPEIEITRIVNGQVNSLMAGMSLRDWFAGQALAGFLPCAQGYQMSRAQEVSDWMDEATAAYALADAMLAARNTRKDGD